MKWAEKRLSILDLNIIQLRGIRRPPWITSDEVTTTTKARIS